MTKPQLFWLHAHFLYWMGGTKYIYEVLKRLSNSYDITVIVEDADSYAVKRYQEAGIPLISLHKRSTNSLLYWLMFPWELMKTKQKVKSLIPPRATLISSMFPMNVIASSLSEGPLQFCFEPFAFFHDPDFLQGFSRPKRLGITILKQCYAWADIWATRRSRVILTLNQVTKKGIRQIYNRSAIPVYTGIDAVHFHRYVSPELKKKYHGQELLIHSTDYTPVKGTDRMIRIFAKVKAQRPSARLLITTTIQNPGQEKKYQELARTLGVEDAVEFLGFVDYNVLPELYSLAKVLVQCSFSGLSGTTSMALPVKEALACGTACIRAPLTTEDVIDGETGYLVDPRNESRMVKRIIDVLNYSKERYHRLSREARARIKAQYTWEQTAERISRIIEKNTESL